MALEPKNKDFKFMEKKMYDVKVLKVWVWEISKAFAQG